MVPWLRPVAERATGPAIAEPYVVVLPGAGAPIREWGHDRFLRAAMHVQQQYGWLCVWAGAPADRARHSRALSASALRSMDMMGRTSSAELLRLVAGAALVLTNESGAAHLASACGVPTVALTGGGHINRFVPWGTLTPVVHPMPCFGCNWMCVHPLRPSGSAPCLTAIDDAQVAHAVARAVGR